MDVQLSPVSVLSAASSVGTRGFPKPSEEASTKPLSHGINSLNLETNSLSLIK